MLIISCRTESKKDEISSEKQNASPEFLVKFKLISFDTLLVYSPELDKKDQYHGVALDSADVALFPKDIREEHLNHYPALFACYKFPISTDEIGLLVRTPSMYVSSSLKFFIYDKKRNVIVQSFELGERWGDAGYGMEKKSWIFREDNQIKAFSWVNEIMDNSIENYKNTTFDTTNSYYLLSLWPKSDTLSRDPIRLSSRFERLLSN